MNEVWQFIGDNHWIFGQKIRGLVRPRLAEVYFDEDRNDKEGGWVWFAIDKGIRGIAATLTDAVEAAEKSLGMEDRNFP